MKGDLILLLGIANIPLYKMIYDTFFQETMRRDDANNNYISFIYSDESEKKDKDDGRTSLFILLCILAVMFEFFIIEGAVSLFIT